MVVKAQWLEGLETPYLWNVSELLLPRERTCLLYRLQDQVRNISHLTFDNFVIGLLLGYELFATAKDVATATSSLEVLEMDLFKMDIVSNCSFYREIRRAQWHTLLASRSVLLASIGKLAESRRVVEENFDPVTVFNSAEKAATLGIKSRAFLEYGPKAWSEALRLAKEAIMNNVNEPEWHFLAGKTLEKIRLGKGLDAVTTEEEIQYFERAVALGKRENQEVHPANISDLIAKQVKGHIITNKQYDT